MKARTPIPRMSEKKIASLKGRRVFSTISSTRKAVRKQNPKATRKSRLRNQKRMRSPEYRAARAGALERSGGRCEFSENLHTDKTYPAWVTVVARCPETERLQFHEEHYARGRILTSDDGKIYCFAHHRLAEKQKPHKQHRGGF